MKIIFKKVKGKQSQIESLFSLLRNRQYNISHEEMPSFENHTKFVIDNPYRVWYLLEKESIDIGSFYIKFDNSIGINLQKYSLDNIKSILTFIKNNYSPLPSFPSMIPPYFYINSPINNAKLKSILNKLEVIPIQISYKI